MLQMMMPKNYIHVVAGLVSLVFEKLGGHPAKAATQSASAQDDLTQINGIGPTFAKRLQAAGIDSFARLAAASPEEVKEAAKLANWQADPADWIAAARALRGN